MPKNANVTYVMIEMPVRSRTWSMKQRRSHFQIRTAFVVLADVLMLGLAWVLLLVAFGFAFEGGEARFSPHFNPQDAILYSRAIYIALFLFGAVEMALASVTAGFLPGRIRWSLKFACVMIFGIFAACGMVALSLSVGAAVDPVESCYRVFTRLIRSAVWK